MNNDRQLSEIMDTDNTVKEHSYGIYWFLLFISLILICLIPDQATWVTTTRGWYTQPMLGGALGLSIMATFALIRVIQSLKPLRNSPVGRGENTVEIVFEELESYRTVLVSSMLFVLYIQSLPIFGFTFSTLSFTSILLWMSRLLNRAWFIANVLTVTALVLIFRVILQIWLPDVWLYSLLPENLADLANQYL